MSFLKSISEFFGFDREPGSGAWPRVVGLNELPPERLPILPPHQRAPLLPGIREVKGPEHQGWKPWSPPRPQAPHNPFRDERMNEYMRDGAVAPPKRGDHV